MHHIDQRNHMVDRRFGQDTVSQIENMARTAARLFEDRAHAVANLRDIGKQRYRVKVALHGDAGTETLPGLRQIDAPIEADYVAPGLAHQFEQIARHRAEVNHGNRVPHRFDNAPGMRQYETAIVVGAETSHPAIEDLHQIGARFDLQLQVIGGDARKHLHHPMPRLGLRIHQRLRRLVLARAATFDQIRRERKRGAGKPDNRHTLAERLAHEPNRIADETQ